MYTYLAYIWILTVIITKMLFQLQITRLFNENFVQNSSFWNVFLCTVLFYWSKKVRLPTVKNIWKKHWCKRQTPWIYQRSLTFFLPYSNAWFVRSHLLRVFSCTCSFFLKDYILKYSFSFCLSWNLKLLFFFLVDMWRQIIHVGSGQLHVITKLD